MDGAWLVKAVDERIGDDLERYKSVLRLPGGLTSQLVTLDAMLRRVSVQEPSVADFSFWMKEAFRCNDDTATNSRYVLERANLLRRTSGGRVAPTRVGIEYISSRDITLILEGFFDAYWGFLELVDLALTLSDELGAIHISSLSAEWARAFQEEFGYAREPRTDRSQFFNVVAYLRSFGVFETEIVGKRLVFASAVRSALTNAS